MNKYDNKDSQTTQPSSQSCNIYQEGYLHDDHPPKTTLFQTQSQSYHIRFCGTHFQRDKTWTDRIPTLGMYIFSKNYCALIKTINQKIRRPLNVILSSPNVCITSHNFSKNGGVNSSVYVNLVRFFQSMHVS